MSDNCKIENLSVLFLGFEKAFDFVCHNFLNNKLKNFCIAERLLKSLKSFLKNQSQMVKINY